MISVREAEEILKAHLLPRKTEVIDLGQANGRILAEPLFADRDFPPYDRVSMDGIALSYATFENGVRTFPVEKTVAAGDPAYALKDTASCIEIMTGTILPDETDTVIRYEDLEIQNGKATVKEENISQGQNVHVKGSDRAAGDVIVKPGVVLGPPELGIAATVGKSTLKVVSLPKVAVVTTGNELVEVDETPLPHQIRASNGYVLKASLQDVGIDAMILHIRDEQKEVTTGIQALLDDFDVILFVGGSSMGKYDLIPRTLRDLEVTEHFYKIKQRPGKPFWFGTRNNESFVFALPGNPVSCFMCLEKYFKGWLKNSLGLPNIEPKAILTTDFFFDPPLTYFLQVSLSYDQGEIHASPVPGGGSGDLANLTSATAFMQLPDSQKEFKKGNRYPIIPFR